jgi:hypothetical protein
MTREDILVYLNNLRKPEVSDPLHKWIGSYNEQRQRLAKFFKWLYSPKIEVSKRPRPTPPPFENIPILKRKEQSIYRPTDIWVEKKIYYFYGIVLIKETGAIMPKVLISLVQRSKY